MALTTLALSGVVPASGNVTLPVRVDNKRNWLIKQVGTEGIGVGGQAIGMIRLNGNPVTPFVARNDAPAGDPPVPMSPGDLFTINWTGATVGATVKALVIYDDGT